MLDYRYLKAFILTAQHSSFSKAANELNIAQSAVSRQIKLLEETLGHELIIRSSKRVLLTEKGKELYLASKNFEETTHSIFENEDNKSIKIGALQGLLENWLHTVFEKYCMDYHNNISIVIDTPQNLKEALQSGKLDIIFSNENTQSELISSLKLFDENLVVISVGPVEISKIHKENWIVYNQEDNLLNAYKRRGKRIIEVSSIPTIVKLVKAGLGVAVVPDHVLSKNDLNHLNVQKFSNVKKSEIFMGSLNFRTMPKHLKTFTNYVQQDAHKYKPLLK